MFPTVFSVYIVTKNVIFYKNLQGSFHRLKAVGFRQYETKGFIYEKLLKACKTLGDYAEYVRRIREYAKEVPIEKAVERAIQECIREDILREFLKKNRLEAKAMSIYEYNEEEHMRMERQDAFADGFKAGSEQEQANTERERQRADKAEEEIRKLREELEKLKKR